VGWDVVVVDGIEDLLCSFSHQKAHFTSGDGRILATDLAQLVLDLINRWVFAGHWASLFT
jgi:uncharacterized protein YigA (DUF484 family)